MQTPTASVLLKLWEQGLSLPSHERALQLLQAACPEMPMDDLARLCIGHRDALLLQLRTALFGSRLVSETVCPHCGAQVELNFDAASILVEQPFQDESSLLLTGDHFDIAYRLPNSVDLQAVSGEPDVAARLRLLMRRCITSAVVNGYPVVGDKLSNEVLEVVESHAAELDPQAIVNIEVSCPECRNCWSAPFDILVYLWAEISAWAMRALQEVHLLASKYGWGERDILDMHPLRRQLYMDLVCG